MYPYAFLGLSPWRAKAVDETIADYTHMHGDFPLVWGRPKTGYLYAPRIKYGSKSAIAALYFSAELD